MCARTTVLAVPAVPLGIAVFAVDGAYAVGVDHHLFKHDVNAAAGAAPHSPQIESQLLAGPALHFSTAWRRSLRGLGFPMPSVSFRIFKLAQRRYSTEMTQLVITRPMNRCA
jgi:hypothetical protein